MSARLVQSKVIISNNWSVGSQLYSINKYCSGQIRNVGEYSV